MRVCAVGNRPNCTRVCSKDWAWELAASAAGILASIHPIICTLLLHSPGYTCLNSPHHSYSPPTLTMQDILTSTYTITCTLFLHSLWIHSHQLVQSLVFFPILHSPELTYLYSLNHSYYHPSFSKIFIPLGVIDLSYLKALTHGKHIQNHPYMFTCT